MKKLAKKLTEKITLKRFTFFIICCVLLGIISSQASLVDSPKEIIQFNQDPKNYNFKLQILDSNKEIASFFVAIANSDESKIYGLMNIKELPKNFGMIFPFDDEEIIYMWMKNTLISLDMVFINEDDVIVHIHEKATPRSLDIIPSEKPAIKVLEINGGLAKKLGIKIGQKILLDD
jgi:uncharacterized protein